MSLAAMDDLGKFVLRMIIGFTVILHGIGKLVNGIGPIEGMVMAHGMPAIMAWGVFVGELIAPALILLGFYSRLGGLLVAINMIVAIMLAHTSQIFQLNAMWGWSLELQGLFLFGGVAIALLGAGRYSVAGRNGHWN